MDDWADIAPKVVAATMATASQLHAGPPVDPIARLVTYNSDDWETFVDEWASHCLKAVYKKVQRFTGPNDKGIDIAGFADDLLLQGVWDNYQCKHYDHSLYPSDVWVELGKILWYSYKGEYSKPRAYYFVAPRGCGTMLSQLLANGNLKARLVAEWDASCRDKITDTQSILLSGDFAAYVNGFDFSIFKSKTVREIIEEHRTSLYFVGRFGGGLPARPAVSTPAEILASESNYVAKLLVAYADHTKEPVNGVAALSKTPKLSQHFQRQREAFYHAESLRVFVRDKVEPGTFESLQIEVFKGVIDTHDAEHADGFQRVVAVTGVAQNLPLAAHPLAPSTFNSDKHGICHQLANDDKLQWTK